MLSPRRFADLSVKMFAMTAKHSEKVKLATIIWVQSSHGYRSTFIRQKLSEAMHGPALRR
jgi:hypothetical protein